MNPLQLVVATDEEIPSWAMVVRFATRLGILSDANFPNKLSYVILPKESPKPEFKNVRFQALYDNFFLWLYIYSHGRLQEKDLKK